MKIWVEWATHLFWKILLQCWEMCLFLSTNSTVTTSPPQIQASNSLPWSQWLYLHESLKKGKSSAVSSKFSCAGRWVGDSVTGWCLRLCCIFHSRAGGLLTLTSHSSMATSFPKYRKSLVTADIRGSCSQSAPTTSSAFKPCRFYNIAN